MALVKKREILPSLHKAAQAIIDMAEEAATLEYYDNERASTGLKRKIREFEANHLKPLKEMAAEIKVNTLNDKLEYGRKK
jgi:hypothetical protein